MSTFFFREFSWARPRANSAPALLHCVRLALFEERIDLRTYQPPLKAPDTNKEELVKGLLTVKKYDYKFLEIDFPELLRKLKRRLK